MGRLAYRRVVHLQVTADGPHYNLPGVQTRSYLDGNALGASYSLSVAFHRLLHSERCVAGAHRVILVSQRRAKESHDPVAHHLVDGALIAVHGFHHVFQHRIENLPRLLGIAVSEQLHGTLHVGEQYSDLLALTFERALGCQNLFGEVLGRVGVR